MSRGLNSCNSAAVTTAIGKTPQHGVCLDAEGTKSCLDGLRWGTRAR